VYWSRRKGFTRSTGVLWPLVARTATSEAQETRLLLGLAGAGSDRSKRELWAYPLFGWSKDENRTSFWSPALSLTRARYDRAEAEASARRQLGEGPAKAFGNYPRSALLASREVEHLLGMAGARTRESLVGKVDESGEVALSTRTQHESFLRPLWLLPVWEHESDGSRSRSELLWRLYDSRREPRDFLEVYTRQRVLWRLVHRETLGARHSVDVFPFIAYDRDENLLQWSFMGGLIGWRHAGDERVTKLFWIPLRRS
jgi:hypothetical protein